LGFHLFPSNKNQPGRKTNLKTGWHKALKRARLSFLRFYDLRSTNATHLNAGGVASEWVTQMLREDDPKAFKKYSPMKLQMKRNAFGRRHQQAN
jgi:hypothetical protein